MELFTNLFLFEAIEIGGGKLATMRWTNKDGNSCYAIKIKAR